MKTQIHIPEQNSKLAPYAMALWEIDNDGINQEMILPNGAIEIVFNLGDDMTGVKAGSNKKIQPARCFAQGISTQTLKVSYTGKQNLFGVRLKPHMVKKLLHVLPSELKDEAIDLSLINGDLANIWNALGEASDFLARVSVAENLLPVLSSHDCPRTQKLSDLFCGEDIGTFMSMDILAREVCYSSRHLNRKTQSMFGLTAEELIAYKRFLCSVNLIHSEDVPMTDIAYRSGFYDQAHFCKTFKSITSLTPGQYKSQSGALPFHLFS